MPRKRKNFSQDEIKFIIDNYPNMNSQEIADKLNTTKGTINCIANKNKIHKENRLITDYEINMIKKHYSTCDLDWLSNKIRRTKRSIGRLAYILKIKRTVVVNRNGSLLPLLNNTHESYYWLGMYAADGYISQNGHFMLSQSEKDKEQVYKLSIFLNTGIYKLEKEKISGYKNKKDAYRVNVCDKQIGKAILDLFNIQKGQTKTQNGISLNFMKDNDLKNISFLIGFIDGDGCIYDRSIQVECHLSWLKVFNNLLTKLPVKISKGIRVFISKNHKKHYSKFYINAECTRFLYSFAKFHNLPYNKRKWGRIKPKF